MWHSTGGRSGRIVSSGAGSFLMCCRATLKAVSPAKRRPPGEHVVTRHAERVDVAAAVQRLAFDLLGAHVERRAQRDADLRQVGRGALADQAGQAEIGDLHLARGGEQNIFRLDVAMHHALFGGLGQARRPLAT